MQNLKHIEEKTKVSSYLVDENNCGNTQTARQEAERASLKQDESPSSSQNNFNSTKPNNEVALDDWEKLFELDEDELEYILHAQNESKKIKKSSTNTTDSVPRIGGKCVRIFLQ